MTLPDIWNYPEITVKLGNFADRPATAESSALGYFARDTGQLFIADLNLEWHDVGLLRYNTVYIPTTVIDGTQITWSQSVAVSGSGSILIEGSGAIYIVG